MPALIPIIAVLLAACTTADPWRHFPQHARALPSGAAGTVPDEDSSREIQGPAPAAQRLPAPARRSVAADPARMPPALPPAPAVTAPSLTTPRQAEAAAPQPVTACDPGGCRSAAGRTQGGTGNVQLGPDGRPCHLRDGWLQCF